MSNAAERAGRWADDELLPALNIVSRSATPTRAFLVEQQGLTSEWSGLEDKRQEETAGAVSALRASAVRVSGKWQQLKEALRARGFCLFSGWGDDSVFCR